MEIPSSPRRRLKSGGRSLWNASERLYFTEDEFQYDKHHEVAHGYLTEQGQTKNVRRFKSMRDVRLSDTENERKRRLSHDEYTSEPTKFLIDVEDTQRRLLAQEDTDGDFQLTVSDLGPKVFPLGTASSEGFRTKEIRGTYQLSNLLQELAFASDYGRKFIVIDERRLSENPVDRMERLIKQHYWDSLTRRIDATGLELITQDPKARQPIRRIYVPCTDKVAVEYYKNLTIQRPNLELDVVIMPEKWTAQWVKSKNFEAGVLSLALKKVEDGIKGVPFVVPGGRFNEIYGWDSYFISLGLLESDRVELSRGMIDNLVYEMHHYHKIPNANRSYYLTRSQPPFLTDMIKVVSKKLEVKLDVKDFVPWNARSWRAAVKELLFVWCNQPRMDPESGLVCYHPEGIGMPPETESTHFSHILEPFVLKHWKELNGSDSVPCKPGDVRDWDEKLELFKQYYNDGTIQDKDLDAYFVHDRGVRESGHDTTYRLEGQCADLATIDLNSLLYKYALDIADAVRDDYMDAFKISILRGSDDEYLESYQRFYDKVSKMSKSDETIDFSSIDLSWARGILVIDEIIDLHWQVIAEKEPPRFHWRPQQQHPKDLARQVSESPLAWKPVLDPHVACPTFHIHVTSPFFHILARHFRNKINQHCWNEQLGIFFDYNVKSRKASTYESVTTTWPLWANLATQEQAMKTIQVCQEKFEARGGLVAGTEESRGKTGLERPNRQWDYPLGWAPHQMMAWHAFENYGYDEYARRLAYRWMFTLTSAVVEFNGVIPEKFDVVNMTHKVNVEYGNVGTDFKLVAREGFGWTNASFIIGLKHLTRSMKRALGTLTPPEALF